MAGAYIKGMKVLVIPVVFCSHPNGKVFADLEGKWREYKALSVPDHGDLIDRTEYRDEFMNGVYDLCADDADNNRANAIIDLFDNSPTIIPADGKEDK